ETQPYPKLTAAEHQAFQNAKEYGVWISGQRVSNAQLSEYQPEQLRLVNKSRLGKNAKNYGKHTYQLTLETEERYQQAIAELRRTIAELE
ncbi:MAG: hypothetical protein AAGA62_02955, partial [Bacteroidota bacterium]